MGELSTLNPRDTDNAQEYFKKVRDLQRNEAFMFVQADSVGGSPSWYPLHMQLKIDYWQQSDRIGGVTVLTKVKCCEEVRAENTLQNDPLA